MKCKRAYKEHTVLLFESHIMSKNPSITEYGVRHFIPKLAKTFEECQSQCRSPARVSQTVLLKTQDNHKLELCLREHIGCCGEHKDKPYWRLELAFHKWVYDEETDEEERDDDYCDAFGAYIGGCVTDDTLYMLSMTDEFKTTTSDGVDVIPRITRILRRAVAAEMCGCGKQMVSPGEDICFNCMLVLEEPNDKEEQPVDMSCPICLKIMSKHSPLTSCCKKMSHVRCLKNCNGKCPFCRTEPFTFA